MSMPPLLRKIGFFLIWPGLFIYFRGSTRARVVIRCGNEILLIRDRQRFFSNPELWTLPGGGIHKHEDAQAAAVRELYEELGVQLAPERLRFLSHERSGSHGLQYMAYFYDVQLPVRPHLKVPSKEVATAHWFSLEAARQQPLKREAERILQLLA